MTIDFFAGFRPPEPPPELRQRVLQAAQRVKTQVYRQPILGRLEWALLAAALTLTIAHLLLPPTCLPPSAPLGPTAAATMLTGDPHLDALLAAEASRRDKDQLHRLLVELDWATSLKERRSKQ